jgi:hypothetical protein
VMSSDNSASAGASWKESQDTHTGIHNASKVPGGSVTLPVSFHVCQTRARACNSGSHQWLGVCERVGAVECGPRVPLFGALPEFPIWAQKVLMGHVLAQHSLISPVRPRAVREGLSGDHECVTASPLSLLASRHCC